MGFERAGKVNDIPAGTVKEVQIGGKAVALGNVGGVFYAIDNVCLHRGGPLGQGQLNGRIVTCPWHGWQYDVTTGKTAMNAGVGVGCFKTEVRGDEVYVEVA